MSEHVCIDPAASDKDLFLEIRSRVARNCEQPEYLDKIAFQFMRLDPRFLDAWRPALQKDAVVPRSKKSVQSPWFHDFRREISDAFFSKANADFKEDCVSETGLVEPDDERTRNRKADRRELADMTALLAMRLREGGVEAYRASQEFLWKYGVHSGTWELVTQYRNICFLPVVAARERAQTVASNEYYFQKNKNCRFWTFAPGSRVTVDLLRERLEALHGKLSDLNRELKERYGWEMIIRCSEIGTPELEAGEAKRKRAARAARLAGKSHGAAPVAVTGNGAANAADVFTLEHPPAVPQRQSIFDAAEDDVEGRIIFANGEPTYHPHAHVVVDPRGNVLSKEKFEEMKSFVRDFMGGYFNEGGVVRKSREVCKYVTKPCDLLKLSTPRLCELYHALFKLKMVQPMGPLLLLRRDLKDPECPRKLARHTLPDGGVVWRARLDHNKKKLKFKDTAEDEAWIEKLNAEPLPEPHPAAKAWMDARAELAIMGKLTQSAGGGLSCAVIGRLRPAYGPAGVKEPRLLVRGTFKDERAVKSSDFYNSVWSDTVEQYEAGLSMLAFMRKQQRPQIVPVDPKDPFNDETVTTGPPLKSTHSMITGGSGETETMTFYDETASYPTVHDWKNAVEIL